MPRVDLDLSVEIERTPRVVQVEGIFDVPEAKRATVSMHFDAPFDQRPWQIGLIVGPSGSGKSSVARHLFGEALVEGYEWHPSRSVVDGFGDLPVRDVTAALSSVGFSSPPSWIKPYHVLSTGERFRATMARALVDTRELIVIDEFTSVVDRTVARIGSSAVAKAIRRTPTKRFVAVSCHDDIVEWLQPDWILEPHVGGFHWRSPQRRPAIELEIVRVHHSAWRIFAPHHYLSASLHKSAACFVALYEGIPVAFDAWLPFVGRLKNGRRGRRGHRTVCLPDYQGCGIGGALFTTLASAWAGLGYVALSRTGHPAEIAQRQRSPEWSMTASYGFTTRDRGALASRRTSRCTHRRAASFRYVGPPMDRVQAAALTGVSPI